MTGWTNLLSGYWSYHGVANVRPTPDGYAATIWMFLASGDMNWGGGRIDINYPTLERALQEVAEAVDWIEES